MAHSMGCTQDSDMTVAGQSKTAALLNGQRDRQHPLAVPDQHASLVGYPVSPIYVCKATTAVAISRPPSPKTRQPMEAERNTMPNSEENNETETTPANEDRGFAAKYRSYLQFKKDNPDYDVVAEDIRRAEAFRAGQAMRREGKETSFFYGTLMDPEVVQEVMGLPAPPVLSPAILKNRGYLRMWGPYPAFVADQNPRVDVKGMACEIEGTERKDQLSTYEGDNYDDIKCLINLVTDDSESDYIVARVFAWFGDEDELREGSFDLEAFKLARSQCDPET